MVNNGTELTPTQGKYQLKVECQAAADIHYILIMAELDAPSREDQSLDKWLHWLTVNIRNNHLEKEDVKVHAVVSTAMCFCCTGARNGCNSLRNITRTEASKDMHTVPHEVL
uniref:Uncharacterized protein n=1 Tax=Glossina austeni TaxID=7395 RepID=A0A1A9VDR6_GLOAU